MCAYWDFGFYINGLTVHRLLQLPIGHDGTTPKYKELSDAALKVCRQMFKKVNLIIIDEISMISNVIFTFIHLRLTEIFNTFDCENGWFGKIHVLVLGDFLQLPPVSEGFTFSKLLPGQITKYLNCIDVPNLWELFEYDELTINMRQKDDAQYSEILQRFRIGLVTKSDVEIINKRRIQFSNSDISLRIEELCDVLSSLPNDTVCLLPTLNMCKILNDAMLRRLDRKKLN